jgi:tetratricopeptide (TPR) repeat protein
VGQRICIGVGRGELPERRHARAGAGDSRVQREGAGCARRGNGEAERRTGESLVTVEKFDVPLQQATTSSLEALKAYSLGGKAENEKGSAAALPYFQRAIQLGPNFAMGYTAVGTEYYSVGEIGRASEYFTKAFELRTHCGERQKIDNHCCVLCKRNRRN